MKSRRTSSSKACLPHLHIRNDCSLEIRSINYITSKPITLAAVCRRWRELVFSMPELWSVFYIHVNKPNLRLIHHHLQLSGPTTPLYIKLFCYERDTTTDPVCLDVFALIKQNLHRLVYFCVNLHAGYLDALASSSVRPESAPLLKEFHIHCVTPDLPLIDFRLCNIPPSPQTVYISKRLLNKVQLDWLHVSKLSLQSELRQLIDQEFIDLLSTVKTLIEFNNNPAMDDWFRSIYGVALPTNTHIPPHYIPITHNAIRKVRLHDNNTALSVFSSTTMPSLESLALSSIHLTTLNPVPAFLRRSACSLTSLELSIAGQPAEGQLIDVLQCTPTIQEFELSLGDGLEDHLLPFLEHLNSVQDADHPRDTQLPLLRKFHYTGALPAPLLVGIFLLLGIVENRRLATISSTTRTRQVQALDDLVIHIKAPDFWDLPDDQTGCDLTQRISDLRAAGKTVSFFLGWPVRARTC